MLGDLREKMKEKPEKNRKFVSIAIDGPSGAGKSTISKKLAQHLGYVYVDTGALYRAIGLFVLQNGILPQDEEAVTQSLKKIDVKIKYKPENKIENQEENQKKSKKQCVFLNGIDVTDKIRTPEVSLAASGVSAHRAVRAFLLDLQRDIAKTNNSILDGRDIATVVLPNADVKIFLTATEESRAQRRFKELVEAAKDNDGKKITFEEVLKDLVRRDKNDSSREVAPLKKAEDAILIDSSEMTFDETFEFILNIIKNNL